MKAAQQILTLLALLALFAAAGCLPYLQAVQPGGEAALLISEGSSAGQTFVADYGGLAGVQFFLQPGRLGQGELEFQLRENPQAQQLLASARLPLQEVAQAGYYHFDFPALAGSQNRYYYASLKLHGTGDILVSSGPADSYLNGLAYQNEQPADVQARFRLSYQPSLLFVGLLSQAAAWSGKALVGFLLFVLPGWALFSAAGGRKHALTWPEKFGIGAGLSLALYPLLLLWTGALGMRLGPMYAWLPALFGAAWAAWRIYGWLRSGVARRDLEGKNEAPKNSPDWPAAAFAVIVVALLFSRLWSVRTLEAPMWGDSVQHAVMTQLILDQNGIFHSWEPYTPYQTLTVQFGFPAAAAVLSWMTGLTSWQAALYTGQLINVLAVAALYPLAMRLTGRPWAAAGVVLLAGFYSPTPAVYVNWGRYAQLTGQAVLPAALTLLWLSLETAGGTRQVALKNLPWGFILLSAAALAGLTLSYYRMPFFYATFAAALLIGWSLPRWQADLRRWLGGLVKLGLVGGLAVLLCLPWGLRVMQGSKLAGLVESGVANSSALEQVLADYQIWRQVFDYAPLPLIILAGLGLLWGMARRQWMAPALGFWAAGLASLVALSLLRVPGANMMQNFAVIIALYIPASLLGGWLLGELMQVGYLRQPSGQALLAALFVGAALAGAVSQRALSKPELHAMVTRPDLHAMAWIRENTPPDSRFLVEGFRVYGFSAVGSDAGWWLPLLAGRENTMPPQYALMNEQPSDPDYSNQVVSLIRQFEEAEPQAQDSLEMLCQWGITHVYIGQGQGQVSAGKYQLFKPAEFTSSPHFRMVYHQDRVFIFAFEQDACEG